MVRRRARNRGERRRSRSREAYSKSSLGRRKLQVSGLWRLQPLAWAQFEYIRSGRVGCCPRAKSCAAADRHRERLSVSRRVVWSYAITHRRVRFARGLSRTDGWLGGGHRAELFRRCSRTRHPPPRLEVSGHRPARDAVDPIAFAIKRYGTSLRTIFAAPIQCYGM